MGDAAPFDTLPSAARWMADAGYVGIQIPTWDSRCIDLRQAAESQDYCDELAGTCREAGVEITELSTHLQGQLVAVHPAYDRSEEHTSELQSLMRISYAVFCLKKKN